MEDKKIFEYEVVKYPAEAFEKLVFFCSEAGECKLDQVPGDQTRILEDTLNEKGQQGWELVQLFFGRDGVIAVWKHKIKKKVN